MTACLDARNLSVTLGGRAVLREVSLSVAPGEFVALIGPNGAGKTTFLRCCAGLVAPQAGQISTSGARLSYLPQGGGVHWDLPVRDIVALGRGRFGAASDPAVDEAMTACRVLPFAERLSSELSGGELARVLLARALAVQAPLILADEPVASLDPAHQIEVMKVLAGEARRGVAVIAVLHDLGLAFTHATRIVLMQDGRIVADGPPASVLASGRLEEAFGSAFVTERRDGVTLMAVRPAP